MPAGGRPTVRSRRLGAALKRHREAADLDQSAAAEAILRSVTKISRLETGQVSASALEVRTLLDRYGVEDPDERQRLEKWARASNERGWWLDYQEIVQPDYADHITLESDATYIRSWEPSLIPGLLQTPAYAESVILSGPMPCGHEKAAQLVKIRQERQKLIEDGRANFTAIIWEPALQALAQDAAVCGEQLLKLHDTSQRQNVTIQILPCGTYRIAGMTGPFVAFSFGVEPNIEAVTVPNATNTSVVEAPEDLAIYTNTFDQLRSAAMSPNESSVRIQELLATSQ
ncbi:helix-turn-helix domain-containing protein [Streptomyces sp. Je 1-369]|uniref:helix-turn-helix domain-containing protein n=1 Tax=Streptomyces sp. Je 1-369 TaxID=2966192 RepID=UPI00228540E0|nr:helix-turn-helix transcriptional regulator [Streptomyces sp. Je 1-369]WAL96024.1 helix-turn-helix domain-containing protein [Streptomyces sp. Je 1-369]